MCEAIEARFKQTFTEPKLKRKIPLLNATKDVRLVKEGTLVRFRCMVQDPNFGHELNMFLVKARNTLNEEERILVNLYSDAGYDVVEPWCISTDPLEGGGHGQFTEVEILYCIGIPGEAPWVCEGDTEIPEYLDEKGKLCEEKRIVRGDLAFTSERSSI
ncbi:hypothetical protein EV182_002183 [Spiromyces aspiralis]|uniref:Uncharacterized protein n=1 Tax=Spiromyces aspiralis TaxID=68401 RepID=A0ACC1HET9_9FUNG|nr:hypothetical protein EV182_002183 [Spiromyces aspiralis]